MNDQLRPKRADGVTLDGEMTGTAYAEPQFLIGRGGRFVQVSHLLYRIAELCDGTHDSEEIAVLVSAMTRRNVSGPDVRELIDTKLAPAGIIAGAGPAAPAENVRSPLAVGLRLALVGPRVLRPLAAVASVFFFPGVVLAALVGTIGARVWLYTQHGISGGVRDVLYEPSLLLMLGALAVGSAAFHELGHAAALRVAGGNARGMGVGLYLIYPVFYTDVTDSYRLGRWRRLLTDVGGFYFNLVFSLFVLGAYVVTRQEALLLAVLVTDLEILHQCLPLGRLDGYWVLADLTGVPDFFSQAMPFVRRLARRRDGTVMPRLRPVARVAFASYLLVIFPILALLLLLLVRNTPRVAVTVLDSFLRQADRFDAAQRAGDLAAGGMAVGSAILLSLPLLAIALLLTGVSRMLLRLVLRISGRDRGQRLVGILSVAAAAALLVALWLPAPFGMANATHLDPIRETGGTLGDASIDAGVTAAPTFLPQLIVPRTPAPTTASPTQPVRTAAPVRPSATAAPTAPPATSAPTTAPQSPTAVPTASPSSTPTPTASSSPTSGGVP